MQEHPDYPKVSQLNPCSSQHESFISMAPFVTNCDYYSYLMMFNYIDRSPTLRLQWTTTTNTGPHSQYIARI